MIFGIHHRSCARVSAGPGRELVRLLQVGCISWPAQRWHAKNEDATECRSAISRHVKIGTLIRSTV